MIPTKLFWLLSITLGVLLMGDILLRFAVLS